MYGSKILPLFAIGLLCLFIPNVSFEQVPMTYIYNAPESSTDVRYEYHWEILRTALEKTKGKYGQYKMVKSKIMSEKRQTYEMLNATGKLTIMYLDTRPEFERDLIAIHIPVDKNLMGYRLLLIRDDRKKDFYNINSIDDLRKFSFGQGLAWVDVDILKYNNFNVITGSSYEGLFEMLLNNRFDVFLRGAAEILDEVELRKNEMPSLYIEETICIYYPLPTYFWFSKTDEGKLLAKRVEEGMRTMIADGTFNTIFDKYFGSKIAKLNLKGRKMFFIKNPYVGKETPFADKTLWFDPKTYIQSKTNANALQN